MNEITRKLQREAERIASKHPVPEFYARFKAQISFAKKLFFSHPAVLRLRKLVEPEYNEQLGHGIYHCTRVSIDAATLLSIELTSSPMKPKALERLMVLAIFAGLLHDICRGSEHHAELGAGEAERILQNFPHLSKNEIACITNAIRNHEAFVGPAPGPSTTEPHGEGPRQWIQLISDCLYDADKFRWGPDTFTHTLWHMADHQGLSPRELIERFPWGMSGTMSIIETFRTPTGHQFGPEIVQTGVEIGKEIYRYLLQHFRGEND